MCLLRFYVASTVHSSLSSAPRKKNAFSGKLELMRKQICLLVLCCLMMACAKAPADKVESTSSPAGVPPQIASTDVVEATPQETTLARGDSGEVLVPIKIANGYHVNANPPSFPYLKATELEIPAAHGISVEFIYLP